MAYVRYRNVSSNGSRRCKEPMMTVKEVAAELKMSTRFVYKLCGQGALEHLKLGGRIRIAADAVAQYVEAQKKGIRQQEVNVPGNRKLTLSCLKLK